VTNVDVCLLLFLDGGFAEHWPDLVVVPLLAVVGWLVVNLISGVNERLGEAGRQIDKNKCDIDGHEKRITRMETVAEERERVRRNREDRT
jgi:hypothetical protein